MSMVLKRPFVAGVAVFFAAMVPGVASASSLCVAAAANPAQFVKRADFEVVVEEMAAACPEVVLMLLEASVLTPVLAPVQSDGDGAVEPAAVNDGPTLLALGEALEALTDATADVAQAQVTLDASLRRVMLAARVREIVIIEMPILTKQRLLSDFTGVLESALTEYEAARGDLQTKSTALVTARTAAVETLQIASLQNAQGAANGALSGKLEGAEYDAALAKLQTVLDAAVAEAKSKEPAQEAAQAELDRLQAELNAMGSRAGLESAKTDAAANDLDAKNQLTSATNYFNNVKSVDDSNYMNFVFCGYCQASFDIYVAYNDSTFKPAVQSLAHTKDWSDATGKQLETAEASLKKFDETKLAANDALAKLDAATAAFDAADAATLAPLQNLLDLKDLKDALTAAEQAVVTAQGKVDQDAGVVAADAAVTTARSRLERAEMQAVGLIEGSDAEATAKAAITSAQAALEQALDVQAEAVDAALAAVDDAKAVNTPAVNAALGDLNEALGAADSAGGLAQQADDAADVVLEEHADAKGALEDELIADRVIKPRQDAAPSPAIAVMTIEAAAGPVVEQVAADAPAENDATGASPSEGGSTAGETPDGSSDTDGSSQGSGEAPSEPASETQAAQSAPAS